ncbi:unnamed protein product [Brachionus calyciflorus]|uniref:Inner centromere protein ARK-binding domain-containing protein n=1 Tax=Brachionus calyciflorus TaxID=104777 RepID=A0A813P7S9_9BILA|nr:unnamed protein product [Brachionus calyciflorus]
MAFINLLKSTSCIGACTTRDSFNSLHDSIGNTEEKVNFINSYIESISEASDFSGYKNIIEKFKQLVSKTNLSKYIQNEELLFTQNLLDRRVTLTSKPKSEKKKIDKEKERKSKKRSAQVAEISVIYEENEQAEKSSDPDLNLQNQIKKILKEKQSKLLQRQEAVVSDCDKINLLSTSKKIRLSEEADEKKSSENLRKSRKKSNSKIKKIKKSTLHPKTPVNKEETVSFIEQIEKLDKAKGLANSKNLKTSFKFTPTNKTICISKIPANTTVKKANTILSTSHQLNPKIENSKTPVKLAKTNSNRIAILDRPKNKVKELIEQFGDKVKRAASKITKNSKKFSPIRSSIGARKAKLSLAKKEIKRKSIKNVAHFVKEVAKEINKTTGSLSVNNSVMNISTQSQKLTSAVKRNPLIVNHKIVTNNLRVVDKAKINNNNLSKTPGRPKGIVNQATFKISKPSQSEKKINPEDLRYDSSRCKQLLEANKKKVADEKLRRLGSTSTISTISSFDTSNASLLSLKHELNSFKTVNTTFDSISKVEQKSLIQKNTTFCVKQTFSVKQTQAQIKPQVINHNQKAKNESFKKLNNDPSKTIKNIKMIKHTVNNATIVVSKQGSQNRSNSVDSKQNIYSRHDDYDVDDLRSGDETDDEDEPSKPIPEWAKMENIQARVQAQSRNMVNFTKLFKASTNDDINLDQIFKIKKKKFYQRSSSAEWRSPTVWRTNGLNGDESFRRLHV